MEELACGLIHDQGENANSGKHCTDQYHECYLECYRHFVVGLLDYSHLLVTGLDGIHLRAEFQKFVWLFFEFGGDRCNVNVL